MYAFLSLFPAELRTREGALTREGVWIARAVGGLTDDEVSRAQQSGWLRALECPHIQSRAVQELMKLGQRKGSWSA